MKNVKGHIYAAITIMIWGTTFISTKILLRSFEPTEILFLRFIIGFIALTVAYPHMLKLHNKRQELTFAVAGLCGVTLYYMLENIALIYTSASNVGVIISIAPFFTVLISHFITHDERLTMNFFIGFVISMIGIVMISFNGSAVKLNLTGDLLAVAAAIVWAVYSVLTKKIGNYGYNVIQSTRRTFFYGIIFMIPTLFIFDFSIRADEILNTINVLNIVFLGLGASALCFVTWNLAVKLLGAVKTSIYIYAVPIITVAVSVLILNEKITLISAVGIILTLGGLLISERKEYNNGNKQHEMCNGDQ